MTPKPEAPQPVASASNDWAAPDHGSALGALNRFVARAGREYARTRNYDFGPGRHANVSRLSPYLRRRLILEQDVLQATLATHSAAAAEKFVQEVFWRTYFKGWLEHRPAVWSDYCADVAELCVRLERDSALRDRYDQAVAGATGIDCFDAWARELVDTGYLHNHARMWFASIWVFTLGLPWQLGADFFLRWLLDGDPASNTLSWRWVCGLHTKGKTYLARASNIASYTNDRFNPSGLLAGTAPALQEDRDYPAQALPVANTSGPVSPFALLVTAEDCSPESLPLAAPPTVVAGLTAAPRCSPGPGSVTVSAFSASAVADGVERGRTHYEADGLLSDSEDWLSVLRDLARTHNLDTIVTAYAPVGPTADRLATLAAALERHGVRLVSVRREYDTVSWPHTKNGFFKLKSRIPVILDRLSGTDGRESPDGLTLSA